MRPLRERYLRTRHAAAQSMALQRLVDPLDACITTVTGLLLLAIVCAGYVLWKPLSIAGLVLAVVIAPRARRATADYLFRFRDVPPQSHRLRRLYLGLVWMAAVASVPFSMAFLQTDLNALAATATANAQWQGPDTNENVLHNLYGATPSWPSYSKCQSMQNALSREAANGCYSAVGYFRSWQIPAALPVMFCLTSLYCGIPLFVARHINQSASRVTPTA